MKRFLLVIVFLSSCANSKPQPLIGPRMYANLYESFEAMSNGWDALDEVHKETKPFLYPFTNENWNDSYYIKGLDWCVCNGRYNSYDEHPEICNYLDERFAFCLIETHDKQFKCAVVYSTDFNKYDVSTYKNDFVNIRQTGFAIEDCFNVGLSFSEHIVAVAEYATYEAYEQLHSQIKDIVTANYSNE